MDARRVLGLTEVDRGSVRDAAARLHAHVAPEPEVRRLVDAAARALLAGRTSVVVTIDPQRLLGVGPAASDEELRSAYLRVARVVHPDAGGTDELFRIVAAAHDALTTDEPVARWATWFERFASSQPQPPPPRPGPWRPPAEPKPPPRRWRLAITLATHGLLIAGSVGFVAVFGREISGRAGMVLSVAAGAALAVLLRGTGVAFVRTAVKLAGPRLAVRPEADPIDFLMDSCLDSPVSREREDVLYGSYVRWCLARRSSPVARWVFVERLRSVGLLFVKASAWQNGTWVGVRLR